MRVASLLLLAALLASCGRAAERSPDEVELPSVMPPPAALSSGAAGERPPARAPDLAQPEQKLIRSGELRLEVDDVERALERADSIAAAHGGLVAGMQATRDGGDRRIAHLTVRVPADRFADAMGALKALGDVTREAVTTEDVTRAYLDLETRLAVKEETAARLRRLLADRTGRLSDVLEVERELGRVVTEIEQMKGERRYYDQRIALSTINLTLAEPGALLRPGSFAAIGQAFSRSLQVLSTSVAWLVYALTFLLPWLALAGLGWWIVRAVRRRSHAS